ncbi:MAG: Flp pilus assembly complex ATPase component TadA [Candidatus Omnitrophica bacterium]|nr:Flp pilus assembly complex ATPase component TadA [Candidatus Omnitrophota bacterium]
MDTVDLLLQQGFITQIQVERAQEEVKRTGLTLDKALKKLGYVSEEDFIKVRADSLGVAYMDLKDYVIDAELIKLIPEGMVRKYKVVPLFKVGGSLTLAMVNPDDIVAIDNVRRETKIENIDTVLTTEKGIERILEVYYETTAGSIVDIISSIDIGKISQEDQDLAEVAEEAPIIKLVNTIFLHAIRDRASDIHIEPGAHETRVRNRVDGVMEEVYTLPKELHKAIASRVKLISGADIAETRKPQDGRISLKIDNKEMDIRVSSYPTVHGENLVLRILDKSVLMLGLVDLGLSQKELEFFAKLIQYPNGIILVTGPTGSGKTTTLYSALTTVNSIEKNILTIEDPVEYELPLIRQTQINPRAGLTFATGLRAILRQDPDIIMVGEIRDKETAEIAIQASLTGHLVLSTLHTNDAPSALTRLIDMGIEPFLVASSVVGILAQRLVRTICTRCKEAYVPDNVILRSLGLPEGEKFYKGRGCQQCKNTGYTGRVGIFELLSINEEIKKLVNKKASADEIAAIGKREGMRTLKEGGIEKARMGLTTLEEIVRVTRIELKTP